ncbi:MAG TPA: signal peptidase I [Solirubrobacteraceae bacterium]|jgi:signal peptidase I|nr:signal peptidase I [Solirubrobacteraceae bacterium]
MRPRRIGKLLSTALGLIVLGALWFCFAPVPLGGSATYVVTHGTSMEPRFHTGDLAIVRPQSSYHVGEIVAYHNHELHTIVLHRIIGREGDRYVFKGDNNDFVDPERPLASQLIGALWIHVPGLGARLQSIRSPGALGALVFLGVLLLAGGVFTGRRRRRGRERRGGEHAPRPLVQLPKGHAKPPTAVLAAGVVALLPCLALALLAFTRAPSARQQVSIPYKQSGTLSYSAAAAPGPAYPDGRVATGEPLFTRVLNAVELRFSYRLHSHASKSLSSVGTLAATITSTNGWHTTLALGPPRRFRGDHAVIAGTLDLGSLQALTDSLEATTKVKGTYTIAVKPRVSTTGTLAGAPLHATLSPEARFAETEGELELEKPATAAIGQASSTSAGKSATEALSSSASGSATGAREEPQSLSLGAVSISVARARTASLVAIALVLGALVALLALLRPLRARLAPERDEPAAIRRRYGHMIVPVAQVSPLPGVAVIDVADMDALVRIAEHYDRSILQETTARGEAFWVADESGQFRYAIGAPPPAAEGAAAAARAPVPPPPAPPAPPTDRSVTSTPAPGWPPAAAPQPIDYEPVTAVLELPTAAPAQAARTAAAPPPAPAPAPATAPAAPAPPVPAAATAQAETTAPPAPAPAAAMPTQDELLEASAVAYMADEVYAGELELGALAGAQSSSPDSPKRESTTPAFVASTGSPG